jgi:ADP-ribose pyrophosphatase YjhB (NUDIX family)
MKKKRIRVISLAVFLDHGRILAFEGYDHAKDQIFFRPLGGEVEFGEPCEEALAREIKEELGKEINDIRLLGTLENIFVYEGETGHEIAFIYDARFVDQGIYDQVHPHYVESDGQDFRCRWLSVEDVDKNHLRLYPQGLQQLVWKTKNSG